MTTFKTFEALQAEVKAGTITLKNLVAYYLQNISDKKHLNAYVEVFEESAYAQAETIQAKVANGTAGKLAGMVVSIKDMISYKNHSLSAGSHILDNFKAIYNSTVVERLLAADAIIIGRVNCDEFAMGGSNETSYYGPTLNDADNAKVPGGSSGGSAVAVQADLCWASLGTDTGGSVRQPAAFTGIVGLKPTYGRVSRHGIVAYASSFDQVGPMAKNVNDAALLLEVIAGHDEFDATASTSEVSIYSKHTNSKPLKIAYIAETIENTGLDSDIKAKTLGAFETLKKQGHSVEPVSFKYLNYLVPTYYVLTMAEASSNLSRYDGVHYGYRSPDATDLESVYKKSRSQGFGPEVKRRIMLGTYILSEGYYDAYYAKAQKMRRLIKDATDNILSQYDVIVMPTTPTTAFEIGKKNKDPLVMYLEDIYTVQANLTGLPAISIPIGKHTNGLDIGIQIMGKAFDEATIIALAAELENNV